MAKRAKIEGDLFAKTEIAEDEQPGQAMPSQAKQGQAEPPKTDYVRSVGVGLRTSDIERLDVEAKRRRLSRGALLKELVRMFLDGETHVD
jgi:hypothetical protein